MDDAALSALFSDYKVAKAHVVRKRNEKSKVILFSDLSADLFLTILSRALVSLSLRTLKSNSAPLKTRMAWNVRAVSSASRSP